MSHSIQRITRISSKPFRYSVASISAFRFSRTCVEDSTPTPLVPAHSPMTATPFLRPAMIRNGLTVLDLGKYPAGDWDWVGRMRRRGLRNPAARAENLSFNGFNMAQLKMTWLLSPVDRNRRSGARSARRFVSQQFVPFSRLRRVANRASHVILIATGNVFLGR